MDHLPIFLDVKGKTVIVDGGGTIAARRVERALDAGAIVHVYAEVLCDEFRDLKNRPSLTHHTEAPRLPDFIGVTVAYGATENEERDRHLYDMANHNHVLANIADVTEYCDFITPSIIDRSPLVIAISSGGAAPIIARILRARIEAILPAAYGTLAAFTGRLRERVMTKLKTPESRRKFWENTIDGPVADKFLSGHPKAAKKQFLIELDAAALGQDVKKVGEVYLVGAGPGDPDLLTFRALHLMQRADVVLYDRLIGEGIINLVRRDAERIFVGKRPNDHAMEQHEISNLMVKLAREGKRVLRLKGGDPFIFGRGGEELEALAAANVNFQVIPGITAASGCASYAGIPLTHRDHAQSCVFVTAHGKDGVLSLDWETMARPGQTVAIYMGRSSLNFLMEEFIRRGVDPNTPAAIVDNGTRPNQQVVKGTLSNLFEKAEAANLPGPALVIVGSVVELSDTLNWYKNFEADKHTMSLGASADL
ncbi:uroporphyrinogen-III C-methyltransferase [Rhodobacterales bacterium 52_120_T64]|nr:uroporphyrinogen-III C-methyltransferase [Rhodobacterales bacterium 52_120_T64]